MRKFLLFFLVGLFLSGCAHSPLKPDEKPTPEMTTSLQELLDNASYGGRTYEMGIFDCSNESALLYDYLTEKGYQCEIVVGIPYYFWRLAGWVCDIHVWLIVKKDGKKFWVDPTFKEVVCEDFYQNEGYFVQITLGSLKNAKKISKILSKFGLCHEDEFEY
ncbi:MAG: hypothetical protein Q8N42_00185 [bacterium]|nr:hypothetical protein [bacterium]